MSCKLENAKPDWKAYVLNEMDGAARRDAENHATSCAACQDEWASLRVTLDAMAALREEEIPRRIAFVSDKVFEPRWWQMFLRPSGMWAAAALIAGAILVHGFVRPAAAPVSVGGVRIDQAALESQIAQRVTAEVTAHVQAQMAKSVNAAVNEAVQQAVAETRQEDDKRTAALLQSTDRRYMETAEFLNKQVTRIYAMNSGAGVR